MFVGFLILFLWVGFCNWTEIIPFNPRDNHFKKENHTENLRMEILLSPMNQHSSFFALKHPFHLLINKSSKSTQQNSFFIPKIKYKILQIYRCVYACQSVLICLLYIGVCLLWGKNWKVTLKIKVVKLVVHRIKRSNTGEPGRRQSKLLQE